MTAPARILVTGGHGFVGSHLLPKLREAFPRAEVQAPTAAMLDITDPAAVAAAVVSFRPEACVHLAAVSAIPLARKNPGRAWQVNLHGTLALAEALREHAPSATLLYPSSADSYGRSFKSGAALDETAPLSPMNVYGATKAAAEMALVALAAEGLRAIVIRPFNHTGAGQTADFAIPAFASQIARVEAGLQPAEMEVGALDPRRDFLDVRDVCDAYVAALARADAIPPGTILNVASGQARRIGDVLDRLIALSGIEVRVSTGASRLRPSEIPTASGNASAARALLGWTPRIDWDATLQAVLDDWRARVRQPTPPEN